MMNDKLSIETIKKIISSQSTDELVRFCKEMGFEMTDATAIKQLSTFFSSHADEEDFPKKLLAKIKKYQENQNILNQQLDMNELEVICGGRSPGNGDCYSDYFYRECSATVEVDSWCGSDDWCYTFSEVYSKRNYPKDASLGEIKTKCGLLRNRR